MRARKVTEVFARSPQPAATAGEIVFGVDALTHPPRNQMKKLITLLPLLFFCSALALPAQAQRLLTPADTLAIPAVSDAQVSPDGGRIVWIVSTIEGNATRSTLWHGSRNWRTAPMMRAGNQPRPLLPAGWVASHPRWSPDGRHLAFISAHEGQSGIWVISFGESGGPPRFVAPVRTTSHYLAYTGEPFAWSPDSRRIAYINATEEEGTTEDERREDPRVVSRIQYLSRTGLADHLRTHVWVTDVNEPQPRQLTSGRAYDHALTWSPRGDEIAFLSNHEPDPDANNNSDIFAVNVADGRVRRITETRGSEYQPAWSPDGRWIAYVATKRDVTTIDSIAEDAHVWVIDAQGRTPGRELTAAQDRRARLPLWSEDSRAIFYLANDQGSTRIYRVELESARVSSIFDAAASPRAVPPPQSLVSPNNSFQVSGFSLSRSRAVGEAAIIAFTLSAPTYPAEVYARPVAPSYGVTHTARISQHNNSLTGRPVRMDGGELPPVAPAFILVEPEEIAFRSFDNAPVQGWLMKPANFRSGQRYPLILTVHGGPHGMYGYGFNAQFQAYAARGYAVLFLNPRGSNGYGQQFSDGTLREWGGGDYRDLMAGVDEALRRYSWLDRDRMGVIGGSYGGFMTNWIITQTPRFKAAVAIASVSNLISFYGTSLYQDLIHAEFGGFPWDDYDLLWRWSPLRYVRAAETPTLFIHGEQDKDVPIAQAEEMYMALRRRGVETQFIRYPREGHSLREPRHRQDSLERTLAWFDRLLR